MSWGMSDSEAPLTVFKAAPIELGDERELMKTRMDRKRRQAGGRGASSLVDRGRGRYRQARPAKEQTRDIAFDASLRAAALRQNGQGRVKIEKEDLHEKQRSGKSTALVVFVVDASGSMGVEQRMSAVKGAVVSLLERSYIRRDRVCLISFNRNEAHVVLPPSRSIDRALRVLDDIPTGGRTPLASAMMKALDVIRAELHKSQSIVPMLFLLTDGRGNVGLERQPDLNPKVAALKDIERAIKAVQASKVRTVVIDCETGKYPKGSAVQLSRKLGAAYRCLAVPTAEGLAHLIADAGSFDDRG